MWEMGSREIHNQDFEHLYATNLSVEIAINLVNIIIVFLLLLVVHS